MIKQIIDRAKKGGYRLKKELMYDFFNDDFAKAFWGKKNIKVGNLNMQLQEWLYHKKIMGGYSDPLNYLKKFFIEIEKKHYNDIAFNKDIFLKTIYPYSTDSKDDWSPKGYEHAYHYKPLSFVADFLDGKKFAKQLLEMFPDKNTLLDLGTATGSVPLTMREVGMNAVGVDGLNVEDFDIKNYMLAKPELYAWNVSPELVDNCDITCPFRIEYITDDKIKSDYIVSNDDLVKFDYIISTDCFEHLIEDRIPQLIDNIYNHLADDGYGIFEINTGSFYDIHQTVKTEDWWKEQFQAKFNIDEELSKADFTYIRGYRKNGYLKGRNGIADNYKILFWVTKK